tara:strand:+ start:1558 stop:2178 length:621 start_codon:yes stop_codon:yes gene_type:complete
MKLTGSYNLKVRKEAVWKALNDANILKECIPGCDSFEKENENTFVATVTNQIGPMNATFTGKINVSIIKENESYTLSGEGNSSVGFANGVANVKLEEKNHSTILNYEVNVEVGGRIAQLGSRLMSGVAKKMSDYFFGRFADLVAPIRKETESKKAAGIDDTNNVNMKVIDEKRVKKLKSNFLNKYIYSGLAILILLLVVIIYFVSR